MTRYLTTILFLLPLWRNWVIHLHVHTRYSTGDALASSKKLAQKISSMGPDPVLGITDHDNMSGIVDHHKACRAHGVKPVYGMEVTTDAGNHLTLLAKNEVGLKNLFRLSKTDKSYEDLSRYRTGVVALSGDLSGAIPLSILKRDKKELNFHLSALHNIYRRDFYLEIIDHGLREQKRVNDVLEKIDLPK
ncbi:PHP domain-containing protein, partial [Candidatus Bathyarchaeota archaeon]|nr:PHP domain-containing protein [Candidatus Bathyarchaeota archaeon]NIR13107.1 PHP domain-containing protein [Desulfobacterales bacterium]NIV67847.1 PHP domain-containing protein [Candidatus Bathyarchaeota archaeon]NIW34436.1 PHP domain-containing protein [Candidatus Bathyarchaeota archaeon]